MSTILILSQRHTGWDLEATTLQEPLAGLFAIETPGSLHCHSDPASDNWRVTGLWDHRGAAAGREGIFPLLKALGKETLQNFPVTNSLFGSLCKGFSIPGNVFWARWILPRYQMNTVKKRQVSSRKNSLISSFQRSDSGDWGLQTICLFYK